MLTTTGNRFKVGGISQTNIQYSKAQINGQVGDVQMGGALRLVFKQDNIKMVDICNTKLCFQLDMNAVGDGNVAVGAAFREPMVPANSLADIFQVISVYWGGIQMNMLNRYDTGMLYRKIKNHLTGKSAQINQGRTEIDDIYTITKTDIDCNKPYNSTAVVDSGEPDTNIAPLVGANLDAVIAQKERIRLAPLVQKLYTRVNVVAANAVSGGMGFQAKTTYNTFSVALGDICPELMNLQCVDPQMFSGSGLEINLQLLDSKFCMMRAPVAVAPFAGAAVAGAADTGRIRCPARSATDKYSISNIFLSLVYHSSITPQLGLFSQVPFTSVYHTKGTVQVGSINHNFNLNSSCFVRGLCVTVNPSTPRTVLATQQIDFGAAGIGSYPAVQNDCWAGYNLPLQVTDAFIQIGATQFPMNQSPPVSNKTIFAHILAQQNSEQIFGVSYTNTLDYFYTTDFTMFFPVNEYIKQGELFSLHIAYENLPAYDSAQDANIMVICDRLLEIGKDGTTRIEQ